MPSPTTPQHLTADDLVKALGLQPHAEGGYFRETHRSGHAVTPMHPPYRPQADDTPGSRPASTSILYLIPAGGFSTFHRLGWEEMWYHQAGSPCTIHLLNEDGTVETMGLGLDPANGYLPQRLVPARTWFSAEVPAGATPPYALVGCAMAPGFSYADWQLAERQALLDAFPQHAALIQRLTLDELPPHAH